jgi:U5 small nuclear ribonucleoprotein component
MMGLASNPEMVRNVAIVGHLHHGKTALVDMLVHETHVIDVDADRQVRPTESLVFFNFLEADPMLRII